MTTAPFPINHEVVPGINYSQGMHSAAFHSIEVEFLKMLLWMCRSRAYKTIVEIGVAEGYASWWLFQAVKYKLGKIYLVDPNLDSDHLMDFLEPVTEGQVNTYRDKSHRFFQEHEKNKRFDLIVIDGNHEYDPCVEDFKLSLDALSKNGTIAIHDTNYMEGVVRAVKDLEKEFVGTWMHYPCGKGLSIYEPGPEWEPR